MKRIYVPFLVYCLINSQTRIHEDEYRRETQINVPILGPEILAVFANSQIFQDHQPTRLSRINSKVTANLVPIHNTTLNNKNDDDVLRRQQSNENLIKRIEGKGQERQSITSLVFSTLSIENDSY